MPVNAALHGRALDAQMSAWLWTVLALLALSQAVLIVALSRKGPGRPRAFSPWNAAAFAAVAILFSVLTVRAESLWAAARFAGPSYDALQVEVVGQQFQWYFRYPGADATFGTVRPALIDAAAGNPLGLDPHDPASRDDIVSSVLLLPAGREVDLRIRSLDVVHGFFIPAMRIKQNAVPGSVFNIHFTPTQPGTYDIVCSQVCGTGHYRMGAQLRVVSTGEYAAWLAAHENRQ